MRFEHYTDEELAFKAQEENTEAAEALINRFSRVCYLEARASKQKRYDEETREGECRLALTRAMKTYAPSKGTKFSSYAKMCMRNAMADMARMEGRRIEEVSIQTGTEEDITIEDVFASSFNVEDEAAESLLWQRFSDVLSDVQKSSKAARALAGKICDELDHDGWSLFNGQYSLFEIAKTELRDQLATKLKDFVLSVIRMRQEGEDTTEIAEVLLVTTECVGLVIKLMISIFAGTEFIVKKKVDKVTLVLQEEDLSTGLFAA